MQFASFLHTSWSSEGNPLLTLYVHQDFASAKAGIAWKNTQGSCLRGAHDALWRSGAVTKGCNHVAVANIQSHVAGHIHSPDQFRGSRRRFSASSNSIKPCLSLIPSR
jgi:hypothetical protein